MGTMLAARRIARLRMTLDGMALEDPKRNPIEREVTKLRAMMAADSHAITEVDDEATPAPDDDAPEDPVARLEAERDSLVLAAAEGDPAAEARLREVETAIGQARIEAERGPALARAKAERARQAAEVEATARRKAIAKDLRGLARRRYRAALDADKALDAYRSAIAKLSQAAEEQQRLLGELPLVGSVGDRMLDTDVSIRPRTLWPGPGIVRHLTTVAGPVAPDAFYGTVFDGKTPSLAEVERGLARLFPD